MNRRTDNRTLPPAIQQEMRGEIVSLRRRGKSNRFVAESVGVSERHASTIWQRYLREGNDAIVMRQRGRQEGDGRVLNYKQETELLDMLIEKPARFKISSELWTRQLLQQAIKKHMKVDVSIRSLGERLSLWGMVPQRPIILTSESNSAAAQKWLYRDYQKIVERAQKEGGEIQWFTEKAGGYAPDRPMHISWLKGTLLAAITNKGQIRFMLSRVDISSDLLIKFMTRLIGDVRKKVFLLLRPIMYLYHDKKVAEWLTENKERIELVYLPAGL